MGEVWISLQQQQVKIRQSILSLTAAFTTFILSPDHLDQLDNLDHLDKPDPDKVCGTATCKKVV